MPWNTKSAKLSRQMPTPSVHMKYAWQWWRLMVSSDACKLCSKHAAHARAAIFPLRATIKLRSAGQSPIFKFGLLYVGMKADEWKRNSGFKTRWRCT